MEMLELLKKNLALGCLTGCVVALKRGMIPGSYDCIPGGIGFLYGAPLAGPTFKQG